MAVFADADQLTRSGVRVHDAERQIRPVLEMPDVVDDPGRPVPVLLLPAANALPPVQAEHFRTDCMPLGPVVKAGFPARLDQCLKLVQPQR